MHAAHKAAHLDDLWHRIRNHFRLFERKEQHVKTKQNTKSRVICFLETPIFFVSIQQRGVHLVLFIPGPGVYAQVEGLFLCWHTWLERDKQSHTNISLFASVDGGAGDKGARMLGKLFCEMLMRTPRCYLTLLPSMLSFFWN